MWSYSPSPCHNFLLLVSSPPRDILLLVNLPRRYHFSYTCRNHLFDSLISLYLSPSQSSSLHPDFILLLLIRFILLFTVVSILILVSSPPCGFLIIFSSPRLYHFTYPCYNHFFASYISLILYLLQYYSPCNYHLLLVQIVFSFSWFLCLYLSRSTMRFSLSLHILVIFFSLSLCLVNITSPILPVIVFSLSWSSYPCMGHLILVLIPLLLFVLIFDVLLLVMTALVLPQFWLFWSTISNNKNYDQGSIYITNLILVAILFSL